MKKIFSVGTLIALMICLPLLISVTIAQPPPPTGPPCWPPPCIPVDGGISLMVLAGIAYGGKKLHDSRKEKNIDPKAE